jgi:hypothetical protein
MYSALLDYFKVRFGAVFEHAVVHWGAGLDEPLHVNASESFVRYIGVFGCGFDSKSIAVVVNSRDPCKEFRE